MPRATRVEPMPRGLEEASMSSMGCSVRAFSCRWTHYVHFHSFLWSLPPWPPCQLVPFCPFHLGNFGSSPKVMSHGSSQPLLWFLQIPRVVSISSAVSTVSILQSIGLDWKCDLCPFFLIFYWTKMSTKALNFFEDLEAGDEAFMTQRFEQPQTNH